MVYGEKCASGIGTNFFPQHAAKNFRRQESVVQLIHLIEPGLQDLADEAAGRPVETGGVCLDDSSRTRTRSHARCAWACKAATLANQLVGAGSRCRIGLGLTQETECRRRNRGHL